MLTEVRRRHVACCPDAGDFPSAMGFGRANARAAVVTGFQLVLALALAGDASAAGARFSTVRAQLTSTSRTSVGASRSASSRSPGRGAAHAPQGGRGPGRIVGDLPTSDPGAIGAPIPDGRYRRRAPDSCVKLALESHGRDLAVRTDGDVHPGDVALAEAVFNDAHAPPAVSSTEAVRHLS
jgi:hypothetical protein